MKEIHEQQSPLAGKEVRIKDHVNKLGGQMYRVEDWWDRLGQGSWMFCKGNPACLMYAIRTGTSTPAVPNDDEVLYGKIDGLGHLVHIDEIDLE